MRPALRTRFCLQRDTLKVENHDKEFIAVSHAEDRDLEELKADQVRLSSAGMGFSG